MNNGLLPLGVRPRQPLFWLFATAAALGLALAVFVMLSSREAEQNSVPLIRRDIPLLQELNDIERKLLAIQVMNQQYFAYSINRDEWTKLRGELHPDFERSLSHLEAVFPGENGLRVVRGVLDNFITLEPSLDEEMRAETVNWDEARAILVEMAIDSGNIRRYLQSLHQRVADDVVAAGSRAEASVAQTARLVAAYSVLLVGIALFVAWQMRARARAEDEIAYNAVHDRVTGCYNRNALAVLVDRRQGHPASLIVLSLKRFSRVTGSLGHDGGDAVLAEVANQLARLAAESSVYLLRLEGARFAMLAPLEAVAPEQLARRIAELFARPLTVGRHELLIDISCGAARYPDDGAAAANLLRNANMAQNHADANGQAFALFSPDFDLRSGQRLALESALGHAVEREELELHYQPQMDIASGATIGMEALVRWRRDGELVSPADFIPVAEDTGLIVGIGAWVLRTACRQAAAWWDAGRGAPVVAINVSPRQFLDPGFFESVRAALDDSGAPPAAVELEITESATMHDPGAVVDMLHRLRGLGVKIAIDDFGTGYSSLSYLRRFPLDKLKVDQSFVRHLGSQSTTEDEAIVAAVVRLGQTLGLKVIAEGVETAEQLAQLRRLGCHEIQGYWFGRPQPAAEAARFLPATQGEARDT